VPTGSESDQKRPANVIGNGVMRIARAKWTTARTRLLGKKGGAARAKNLTPERRAEIATKAAQTRWAKSY
jgi:hypothetical protein